MRIALFTLSLIAPLSFAAAPAAAQDRDPTAATAIAAGDYGKAEATLVAELRKDPYRPELLLNLAAVYTMTGRQAEARTLYGQVLAQRDYQMDMPSGDLSSSHTVARAGLHHLNPLPATQSAQR